LIFQFLTGVHLDKILKNCRVYNAEMEEFQLANVQWLALPFWQLLEKLRGNELNPHQLSGDVFDYDTLMHEITVNEQEAALANLLHFEVWLTYLFDDFISMPHLIRESFKHINVYKGHFAAITFYTHIGVACESMLRKTEKRYYKRKARAVTKLMTDWASTGVVAAQGNAAMLNALLKTSSSRVCTRQLAETTLLEAIDILHSEKHTFPEGMLYERLVEIMLEHGDRDDAKKFLRLAIKTFDSIGAMSKVLFLRQEKFPELIQKPVVVAKSA
jgi:hypothetical protein